MQGPHRARPRSHVVDQAAGGSKTVVTEARDPARVERRTVPSPYSPSCAGEPGGWCRSGEVPRAASSTSSPREDLVVVGNTGDDDEFHGLFVCPDLDSVTYTLAGRVEPALGWGLEGETFAHLDALDRYDDRPWFRLGDRDLATHLYRTARRAPAHRFDVTAEIATAWGSRSGCCR